MPADPGRRSLALASGAWTLLCVLLPALVAGAHLDDSAHPGEVLNVVRGMDPHAAPSPRSWPALLYFGAATPGASTLDALDLLPRARLASVAMLVVITSLLWVTLTLVRRRSIAAFACLALAVLPPVAVEGVVLRPEVPAAAFGGLAVLMVVMLAVLLAERAPLGRALFVARFSTMVVAGVCIGLAAACVPRSGVLLLVPGGALALCVLTVLVASIRTARRRSVWRWPSRALQRRLMPWVLLAVLSFAAAAGALQVAVDGDGTTLPTSVMQHGLWPATPWAAVPLWILAACGALHLLISVGRRVGRRHRVTPDAVVLVFAAVVIAQQGLLTKDSDALLAAPAAALLVGEGVWVVIVLVRVWFAARHRRRLSRASRA